ncbi:hypothetical protein R1sor_011085 [Riccia sorocarpa]|uniref:Uncharacterized protein n=1 Tax=Riccia sorocarpa TaxID=122646 RepID=A0ABD3I5X4_9MARC
MENVDAAFGRLLRLTSTVDSTQIVAELKEVVTELKTLRSDSELLAELRAMSGLYGDGEGRHALKARSDSAELNLAALGRKINF